MDDGLRAKYRSNYDVMFSTEDPFAMSNRQMKKALKKGNNSSNLFEKVRYVLKNEGVSGLIVRIKQRL